MFDQESYDNSDFKQVRSDPGDLFHNYEIKNWVLSRTIYIILAISAVLNLSVLAFIGQTNLLTRRGCDSPFVGRVCQVLDMAYVGTVLFGTEREYADMEYEKTDLGDADITYIDVSSDSPPLTYPPGYFQIANPVQFAMQQEQLTNPNPIASATTGIPGFPMISAPRVDSDLLKQKARPPAANPNAFQDDSTTSLFNVGGTTTDPSVRKSRRGGRPIPSDPSDTTASANTKPANANTASPTPTPSTASVPGDADEAKQDQYDVFINKRPLKDYAKSALENIDNKTVVLDKPVKVVIAGTLGLGKDGKTIVLKDPKPVRSSTDPVNDPAMEKFVQGAILAVGDAGWFGYLDKFKVKNVVITIEQNDANLNLIATVRSDQPSEMDAYHAASGLNSIISLSAAMTTGDEQTFLKSAKTTSEGKTFILNFEIPKPLVQELVLRKLTDSRDKVNKPNSTALVSPNNKNTSEK